MVGESDVVLDESRVLEARTRTFFPTFMEYVSDGNAEQKVYDISDGADYQAPQNFTLFITHISLGIIPAANNTGAYLNIPNLGGGVIQVNAKANGEAQNATTNLQMPLRVPSGAIFNVKAINGGTTHCIVFGFLLPSKISIR